MLHNILNPFLSLNIYLVMVLLARPTHLTSRMKDPSEILSIDNKAKIQVNCAIHTFEDNLITIQVENVLKQ